MEEKLRKNKTRKVAAFSKLFTNEVGLEASSMFFCGRCGPSMALEGVLFQIRAKSLVKENMSLKSIAN